ncbi:hypothetical protein CAOG_005576 [Capsaspora owczarzaki ATCC 30864]|uniref:HIT-type domain-containing protein n=1 Tax=Capsaspora owczarzaki (strain ATCC 30864) TaxID=595528 RepID=A0A0D2X3X8_CAPO3|nr:hypothetical protein CAOG_005576 [Capsaspora owczarzaki ATCC 30864]
MESRSAAASANGVTAPRRVMDEQTRQRRQRRQLETLESDNFQDQPHLLQDEAPTAAALAAKAALAGDDANATQNKRRRKGLHKFRPRKAFAVLLEESGILQQQDGDVPTYVSAAAPPSQLPDRKICAVCGFHACYSCVPCGARCLKWMS